MFYFQYQHQIDAIDFLIKNSIEEESGYILAHHMGLGKTLTTVAFLNGIINFPESNVKTILILTPKSTIQQWIDESKKLLLNSKLKKEN